MTAANSLSRLILKSHIFYFSESAAKVNINWHEITPKNETAVSAHASTNVKKKLQK